MAVATLRRSDTTVAIRRLVDYGAALVLLRSSSSLLLLLLSLLLLLLFAAAAANAAVNVSVRLSTFGLVLAACAAVPTICSMHARML